jgi:hypothetical protein
MDTVVEPSWARRNWQWLLPVGVVASVVLFFGCIAAVVMFVFGLMTSSDVYRQALMIAQANPAVVEALGTPIKAGYFTSGSYRTTGPSGSAELAIPVSGPKGAGTIYLEARKSADEWTFTKLVFASEKSTERVQLLKPAAQPTATQPP